MRQLLYHKLFSLTVSSGSVAITGTATQAEVLTADTSGINDADGNGFSYQWVRDAVNIDGETNSTYTLTDADVNANLALLSTTLPGGQAKSLTSAPTASVANINDAPTISVANQTAILGVDFSYLPTVTDAANDATNTYTFSITGTLPSGLSFDASTGGISGTPDTIEVATTPNHHG